MWLEDADNVVRLLCSKSQLSVTYNTPPAILKQTHHSLLTF